MEKKLTITIPIKTPTINHLYWHKGNIKILTKEARDLRKKIGQIVSKTKIKHKNEKLNVEIFIYENWLTKKGEIKKKDISNREKFLIDSLFNSLGIDDKFIFKHQMSKIQSEEEKTIINITVIDGE